jgi:hypothetical protein
MMTTTTGSPRFPFPHAELTPIVGKPTAVDVQLLQKKVYANTRAVHCTRGGGANGYLGITMDPAVYLARAGKAFIPPAHPGNQLVHAANATVAQTTVANRTYDDEEVREAIRQQILTAVDATYHGVLADADFGYADVTISVILTHLRFTYAKLTGDDLETNRTQLATMWNPDEPIENLWLRIKHIRAVATAGQEPITDSTVIRLTLVALDQAGVYAHPIKTWRDKPDTDRTWNNFVPHFEHSEKERIRLLTGANAGYHGANKAIETHPPSAITPQNLAAAATTGTQFQYNTCPLFYCWTHGLNRNPQHTSGTCSSKGKGHKDDATLDNRQGGNAHITFGDPSSSGQCRVAFPPT